MSSPFPPPYPPNDPPDPPRRPPAPPPSPPPDLITIAFTVKDSQIITSLTLSLLAATGVIIGFGLIRGWMGIYQKRTDIEDSLHKYKRMKLDTLHRFYSFLIPIFTVTEEELLKACGVDAMMLLRTCTLGIQLFLPLTVLGCAIILPINLNGHYVDEQASLGIAAGSSYMYYSIANLPPQDRIYWVHTSVLFVFLCYAMWLLSVHYRSYALLKLTHLTQEVPLRKKGDYGQVNLIGVGYSTIGFRARFWRVLSEVFWPSSTFQWGVRQWVKQLDTPGGDPSGGPGDLASHPPVGVRGASPPPNPPKATSHTKESSQPDVGRHGHTFSLGSSSAAAFSPSFLSVSPSRPLDVTRPMGGIHRGIARTFEAHKETWGGHNPILHPVALIPWWKRQVELPEAFQDNSCVLPIGKTVARGRQLLTAVPRVKRGVSRAEGRSEDLVEPSVKVNAARYAVLLEATRDPGSSSPLNSPLMILDRLVAFFQGRLGGKRPLRSRLASITIGGEEDDARLPASVLFDKADIEQSGANKDEGRGNEQAIAPEEGGEVLYGPYGIDRVEVEVEEEDREGEMRVRRRSVRLDQIDPEIISEVREGSKVMLHRAASGSRYESAEMRSFSLTPSNNATTPASPTPPVPGSSPTYTPPLACTPAPKGPTHSAPVQKTMKGIGSKGSTVELPVVEKGRPPLPSMIQGPGIKASKGSARGRGGGEGSFWGKGSRDHDPSWRVEHAEDLFHAFRSIFPHTFEALVPVYNHEEVDDLLYQLDALMGRIERAEYDREEALRLARVAGEGEVKEEGKGSGSGGKKGCCLKGPGGGHGERAESLADELVGLCQEKVQLDARVILARDKVMKEPPGVAFLALFSSQRDALQATYCPIAGKTRSSIWTYSPRLAPHPEEVNWQTLWTPQTSRRIRQILLFVPLLIAIFFPIGIFTGFLTNLNAGLCFGGETNKYYWPWFCTQQGFFGQLFKSLLTGSVPSLVSGLWNSFVMPLVLFYICQGERRYRSLSELDQRIGYCFFLYAVINNFLMVVLAGGLSSQLGIALQDCTKGRGCDLNSIITSVAQALAGACLYFFNNFIWKAFYGNIWRMIWPHNGLVIPGLFRWLLKLMVPKTDREKMLVHMCPSMRCGRHYGAFFLVLVPGMTYAVINPVILPLGLAYFLTAWIVWKYCILFVYEHSHESGGGQFEQLFENVMSSLYITVFFTGIVFISRGAWGCAGVVIVLFPIMLMQFGRSMEFFKPEDNFPLEEVAKAPSAKINPLQYLPPGLRNGAVGWYPEQNKVWEMYGVPRYA